jgi:hypothetical protein
VDLIGIEPVTSSMPWNEANIKISTAKDLQTGQVGKTGLIGGICDKNATNFLAAGQRADLVGVSPISNPS